VVGVLFLSFTVTFFIGNTLIHSYFSNATKPAGTLITGVLIGLSGLADAAVGLAMRPVLTPVGAGPAPCPSGRAVPGTGTSRPPRTNPRRGTAGTGWPADSRPASAWSRWQLTRRDRPQ
jgi:hypothetical protein